MYVADMSIAEAKEMLTFYKTEFKNPNEQERWDMEDLADRIAGRK